LLYSVTRFLSHFIYVEANKFILFDLVDQTISNASHTFYIPNDTSGTLAMFKASVIYRYMSLTRARFTLSDRQAGMTPSERGAPSGDI